MTKHKKITQYYEIKMVRDFIETARQNGMTGLNVSDLALSIELKTYQCRSGKMHGMDVLASAHDGLGNVTVLTTDHRVLQLD